VASIHFILKSVLWNAALAVVVVLGFYFEIIWAEYLAIGFIWLMLILYSSAAFLGDGLPLIGPATFVGTWIIRVYDVGLTLALFGSAAYVTALACAASYYILYHVLNKVGRGEPTT